MASATCKRCDQAIDQLKTADWSRYDAETKYVQAVDYNRRLTIWVREQMTAFRIRGSIPGPEELERMYPNAPVTRPPERPKADRPAVPG